MGDPALHGALEGQQAGPCIFYIWLYGLSCSYVSIVLFCWLLIYCFFQYLCLFRPACRSCRREAASYTSCRLSPGELYIFVHHRSLFLDLRISFFFFLSLLSLVVVLHPLLGPHEGGKGTFDWDTVASICTIGNPLSSFHSRISWKSSNREIWARRGFPTVSPPPSEGLQARRRGLTTYIYIYIYRERERDRYIDR